MTINKSTGLLFNDLKRIQSNPNENFSVGIKNDMFKWDVAIFGPQGTPLENGIFQATMKFLPTYPDDPPVFTFITPMYHPNINPITQDVCISILHKSGEDAYGYECFNERWLPVRNPEGIILSIISLLCDPNCESPANIEAAMLYMKDKKAYESKIREISRRTLEF